VNKLNVILILSGVIFLLPFLGFPQAFDNFLYVVLSIAIFVLALLLKSGISKKYVRNESDGNTGGNAEEITQE